MAPAFSKEAILQGSIDHLCLVCERYLRSERDVCLHVSTAEHTQNLDSTDYVEKYRDDRVRKVKKWYFCEFCNALVSTLNSVKLHVNEASHLANRSQTIARLDGLVVAGNTAINEEAWQGLVEETCIICNVEYEDQDVHRNETGHIINLIQSKVSDNCYRKIDDSTFHCLTCNEVVAEIAEHLDGTNHKQAINQPVKIMPSKLEQDKNFIKSSNEKITMPNAKNVKDNHKQSSEIIDSIPHFQKNNISINLESRTAVCKRCSMNIEFRCTAIENHIEEHKNKVKKKQSTASQVLFKNDEKNKTMDSGTLYTSPVSRTTERENNKSLENKSTEITNQKGDAKGIQKMAEEFGLTYITGGNQVHCQMCNKYIPLSIEKIMAHVVAKLHKSQSPSSSNNNEIEKKNGKKCNFKKVPAEEFTQKIQSIKTQLNEDVVVNDKYCIEFLSFYFLKMIVPGRFRCQICGLIISIADISDHLDDEQHRDLWDKVLVIIHPDLEFVREVRSNTYHCGYCNIIDTWEGIEDHLKSSEHKETKAFAKWRLNKHLPLIHQRREERQLLALMMNSLLQ